MEKRIEEEEIEVGEEREGEGEEVEAVSEGMEGKNG